VLWFYNFKKTDFKKNQKTVRSDEHFKESSRYKINLQKSVFLYTNNELAEKEIKKTIPFIGQQFIQKNKYLGINLTKEAKDLYNGNDKMLKKNLRRH
jgi:hypothetical protein